MADNIAVTPGTGATIGAKDMGSGVLAQRVLPVYGTNTDVTITSGLPIQGTQLTGQVTSWTSATSINTANTITVTGMNTVSVACVATTTITAGVLTFEVSPDNTNWFPITLARIDSFTTENTYALVASTNRAWSTSVDGFNYFRVRLSTAITGTGTVGITLIPQTFAIEPIVNVGQSTAASLQATVTQGTASATPWAIRAAGTTTSSGLLIAKILSAATTNATLVLTGARAVYGWHLTNSSASWRYVRIYNKATTPTVGTDSPLFVLPIPPGGGAVMPKDMNNIALSLGFGYSITGSYADLDTTVVAAGDVVGTIWYI